MTRLVLIPVPVSCQSSVKVKVNPSSPTNYPQGRSISFTRCSAMHIYASLVHEVNARNELVLSVIQ